jgi:glycerophosphoryl diester phosphodiesterase
MKKLLLVTAVLFLMLSACQQAKQQGKPLPADKVTEIREKLMNRDESSVIVVAHRGDWRNFPENSLEAIDNAIKMGVDVVELDVQCTLDSLIILMHDGTLDRTTTGKGKIAETPYDSIKPLNLKNGCAIRTIHKVPTLEEALLHAKGKIMVNLDKADRYFDRVYALMEKTGTTKQVIMKGTKNVEKVKELYGSYLNDVIYMPIVNMDKPNAREQINLFMSDLNPAAFELLFVNDTNRLAKEAVQMMEGRSLIWYNTLWDTMAGGHDDDLSLQDPDKGYGYLIDSLGARIIQTDRPQMLLDYLRERNLHQ